MSIVKNYIQYQLFKPPKPLLLFPVDFDEPDLLKFYTTSSQALFDQTSIPNISIIHPNPVRTIIYYHGNSENLMSLKWFISDLSEVLHANVFSFEYPGYYKKLDMYTEMQIQPSEKECFSTAEKFTNAVREMFLDTRVYLLGYSMGCALALHSAEYFKKYHSFPTGVILLAPFVSTASVVLAHSKSALSFSTLWAPFDVFPMKHAAFEQGKAIIVAAGGRDEVVPIAHSQMIAEIASKHSKISKFLEVPEATHGTLRTFSDVWEEVISFFVTVEGGQQRA